MAQPETQIKTKTKIETQTKQRVEIRKQERTHDPISRREDDFEDAPMFKVMLLEDNGYDAEHVVTRLCGKCVCLPTYLSACIHGTLSSDVDAVYQLFRSPCILAPDTHLCLFVRLSAQPSWKTWTKMPPQPSFNRPCKRGRPCAENTLSKLPSCTRNSCYGLIR